MFDKMLAVENLVYRFVDYTHRPEVSATENGLFVKIAYNIMLYITGDKTLSEIEAALLEHQQAIFNKLEENAERIHNVKLLSQSLREWEQRNRIDRNQLNLDELEGQYVVIDGCAWEVGPKRAMKHVLFINGEKIEGDMIFNGVVARERLQVFTHEQMVQFSVYLHERGMFLSQHQPFLTIHI